MGMMLDTSVAIHLRDGDEAVRARVLQLDEAPVLSIITRIELEGGLVGPDGATRKRRFEEMLAVLVVLPFDEADADVYRHILSALGFSRRKTMDRLIASQAIATRATLVTLNGSDFRDIPDLKLLEW